MTVEKWSVDIELSAKDVSEEQVVEMRRILEGEGEEVADLSEPSGGGLSVRLHVEASTPYIAFHLGEAAVARAARAAGLGVVLAGFSVSRTQ